MIAVIIVIAIAPTVLVSSRHAGKRHAGR
jgi:hypothetical protein